VSCRGRRIGYAHTRAATNASTAASHARGQNQEDGENQSYGESGWKGHAQLRCGRAGSRLYGIRGVISGGSGGTLSGGQGEEDVESVL
jgi:hypothetical protein